MMSCTYSQNDDEIHCGSSKPITMNSPKDEDTEALAGFLLALKHRSVTPEPTFSDSCSSSTPCHQTLETTRYHVHSPVHDSQSGYICSAPLSPPQNSSKLPDSSKPEPHQRLMDFEDLISDSKLVSMEDRDLVPDPLFAAMAQMKPCRLQHADRVGCYKNRELGFLGMCCKWCGGQPGFGRYYPNSVRSLAQTTTSQTILKHIGSKCRFCPPEVRNSILALQELQASREGLPTGRPRYGSRKIFFQRVWQRLHHGDFDDEDFECTDDKRSVSVELSEEGSIESTSDDDSSKRSTSSCSKRRKMNSDTSVSSSESRNFKRAKIGDLSLVKSSV